MDGYALPMDLKHCHSGLAHYDSKSNVSATFQLVGRLKDPNNPQIKFSHTTITTKSTSNLFLFHLIKDRNVRTNIWSWKKQTNKFQGSGVAINVEHDPEREASVYSAEKNSFEHPIDTVKEIAVITHVEMQDRPFLAVTFRQSLRVIPFLACQIRARESNKPTNKILLRIELQFAYVK